MKVVHITPNYFDDSSRIGGGERYPTELASWMANVVDTTLVSFSTERESYCRDNLQVEVYPVKHLIRGSQINPLSFQYLLSIVRADVIHIHGINTIVSDLGCLTGSFLRKRVFVTDHGGGGNLVLNHKLPVFGGYRGAVAQSQFTLNRFPRELQKKGVLVKGGVNSERFCPDASLSKEKKILYVGRILHHKGINYLIEGFRILNRPDYQLKILGRVYSEQFYQDLKEMAMGLPVEFIDNADDQRLLHEYRTAKATVLPSVHTNCYGKYTPVPELMGFTLLESQACGTPVICTDAGAMDEFVDHGHTGFVVKQNSGEAIAAALNSLISLFQSEYAQFQANCREWIQPLSWSTIVQRHLELYQGNSIK